MLLIEEMMFRPEFEVFKATSGAEALKLAAEHLPDAILLDIMADMRGLETGRLLRIMPATKTYTPPISKACCWCVTRRA